MEKAKSKTRIRVTTIMMVLTALGCIVMIYSGKKSHAKGESLQKMNQEWHKKYSEENATKTEAKK